jgi:ring-1,2-phenylacetyl-CoA epoxidase subunit PaaE
MSQIFSQSSQAIMQFIISLAQNFATGFILQYAFILVFYIVVWMMFAKPLSRYRIQTQKRAGKVQIFDEFKNGFIVLLINTVTTPFLLWLNDLGYIKIYQDINAYGGIWYVLFTSVVLIVVSDGWFYWTHRWLHTPKVYKYIHAVHHKSLDTTPFTSLSFHVVEGFLQSAFIYILVFVMPINTLAIGITQVIGLLNNIKSHLGYEFYPAWFSKTPLKYLANSTHHNLHHTRYNGNYGLFFTYWDILCGTEFDNQNELTEAITHRKTPSVILDNSSYKTLQIDAIHKETHDTVSIYFKPTDRQFYEHAAGSYINLRVPVQGKVYDRVFSLSSSPVTDDFLRITVKKHSVVTTHLFEHAKPGDTIQALYPYGEFTLDTVKVDSHSSFLFVAGGSGITPLFSMIQTLYATHPDCKATLLYANKSAEDTIFKSQLETLSSKHSNFTIRHYISGKNRLTQQDVSQALASLSKNVDVYICGPEGLKIAVKDYVRISKHNSATLHEEDFADGYVGFLTDLHVQKAVAQ